MAVHGTRHRESVSWDYSGLLQLLGNLARERAGMPLLRCYWYESSVEGRRGPEHEALADLPGLKLRLGRSRQGGRSGVDAEMHRDLMTLARNKAIADAVVVSGDEDLATVLADAQDLGLRVTVVHVAVDGNWTISRVLRQECDDLIEVGSGHLRPYVNLLSGGERQHESARSPLANGQSTGGSPLSSLPSGLGAPAPAASPLTPPPSMPQPAQHQPAAQHQPSQPQLAAPIANGTSMLSGLPYGSSSSTGAQPSYLNPPSTPAQSPYPGPQTPPASSYQASPPSYTASSYQPGSAYQSSSFPLAPPSTPAQPQQHGGPYSGPQALPVVPQQAPSGGPSLSDAVKAAHTEGQDFGESVARDAPALWLEAVLARKPRMPSDLEARLLQGSALPIDFLLHDEVRHALRRGFWDALERSRR